MEASSYLTFDFTSYEGFYYSVLVLAVPYAVQIIGTGAFLIGSSEVVVLDILANWLVVLTELIYSLGYFSKGARWVMDWASKVVGFFPIGCF